MRKVFLYMVVKLIYQKFTENALAIFAHNHFGKRINQNILIEKIQVGKTRIEKLIFIP